MRRRNKNFFPPSPPSFPPSPKSLPPPPFVEWVVESEGGGEDFAKDNATEHTYFSILFTKNPVLLNQKFVESRLVPSSSLAAAAAAAAEGGREREREREREKERERERENPPYITLLSFSIAIPLATPCFHLFFIPALSPPPPTTTSLPPQQPRSPLPIFFPSSDPGLLPSFFSSPLTPVQTHLGGGGGGRL